MHCETLKIKKKKLSPIHQAYMQGLNNRK